jgi:segregation and condensation protein A
MDPEALNPASSSRPAVVLPVYEGPLDLLLHLVREHKVSIWDVPIVAVCDQYQEALRRMEELDIEIAGEYLVYAAWLLAIKSRMLLPRPSDARGEDPRAELVQRLAEYEKVKAAAAELAGLDEVRQGMLAPRVEVPGAALEEALDLAEADVLVLAETLRRVLERHRLDNPAVIDVPPLRFSVREKIVELFERVCREPSFPLLSHVLTRPERLEGVTLVVAALELVRLGNVEMHQRAPFSEIYLTGTGKPLSLEALADA